MKTKEKAIGLLGLFFFIYLGLEYQFDNMMAYVTDAGGVVLAQSWILGISVPGFLSYVFWKKRIPKEAKAVSAAFLLTALGCIYVMSRHTSYWTVLVSGIILFYLLGCAGGMIHNLAAENFLPGGRPACCVGVSYAFGIFLQFLNHKAVLSVVLEQCILALFLVIGVYMAWKMDVDSGTEISSEQKKGKSTAQKQGILLVILVALMTFIFSSLDNTVTLVHAGGSIDIGQWPRLLLACSGLAAGFLFDIKNGKYMQILMYCVTLLSTTSILVIGFGGSFLTGLVVFYLSAGFFSVYFTVVFMKLSREMREPGFWASMGRAVNNAGSVIAAAVFAFFFKSDKLTGMFAAVLLFAFISVVLYIYQETEKGTEGGGPEEQEDRFLVFVKKFALTEREQEVLHMLITSDDNVQQIADELAISRAALYRHISNMNEKTHTKARIGLIQFYFEWQNKNTGN